MDVVGPYALPFPNSEDDEDGRATSRRSARTGPPPPRRPISTGAKSRSTEIQATSSNEIQRNIIANGFRPHR
jgi:hypothetical protein